MEYTKDQLEDALFDLERILREGSLSETDRSRGKAALSQIREGVMRGCDAQRELFILRSRVQYLESRGGWVTEDDS